MNPYARAQNIFGRAAAIRQGMGLGNPYRPYYDHKNVMAVSGTGIGYTDPNSGVSLSLLSDDGSTPALQLPEAGGSSYQDSSDAAAASSSAPDSVRDALTPGRLEFHPFGPPTYEGAAAQAARSAYTGGPNVLDTILGYTDKLLNPNRAGAPRAASGSNQWVPIVAIGAGAILLGVVVAKLAKKKPASAPAAV